MANPKEEQIENKVEETGSPKPESELSEADFEKVAGGMRERVSVCVEDACTICG